MDTIKTILYWGARVYLAIVLVFVCSLWFVDPSLSIFSGDGPLYYLFIFGFTPLLISIPFGIPIALLLLLFVRKPESAVAETPVSYVSQRTKVLKWVTAAIAASLPLSYLVVMGFCLYSYEFCFEAFYGAKYYPILATALAALLVSSIALLLSSLFDKRRNV